MNIRFTSTLTPDHENLIAPAVLKAIGSILDLLPIAYVLRIDTADAQTYTHTGPGLHLSSVDPTHAQPAGLEKFES